MLTGFGPVGEHELKVCLDLGRDKVGRTHYFAHLLMNLRGASKMAHGEWMENGMG